MGYRVVQSSEHVYEERPGHEGQALRLTADLTVPANLQQSRARLWRYPPHTRGRRHADHGQEEVFLVLEGTVTILLGDPAERFDLLPRSVVSVEQGTALQLRNETDEEVVVFAYGAPPVTGQAEFLEDIPQI